jgi:ribosomal protein S18 acetylase RimI-like enzyme
LLLADLNDAEEIVQLVNSAYRGESSKAGWTTEADLLDGQRVDLARIHEQIQNPNSVIGLMRSTKTSHITAVVHLEKKDAHSSYLGMLTVNPKIQNSGLGKQMLLQAEQFCKENWLSQKIEMTVIASRKELIEYYQRRGYHLTGERRPFPTHDPRFGIPKVQNLEFVVLEKQL